MINLLSPNRLVQLKTARQNTILVGYIKLVVASALVLGAMVLGTYHLLGIQRTQTIRANRLDRERINSLEPYQQQAKDLASTISAITAVLEDDTHFSEVLTNIGGLIPTGAALTGLQLSVDDLEAPLIVKAHVDSEQKASVLLNNLATSTLFESVKIQHIERIEAEGGPYNHLVTLNVHVNNGDR